MSPTSTLDGAFAIVIVHCSSLMPIMIALHHQKQVKQGRALQQILPFVLRWEWELQ
jgi:hypothetical protein